jgi:hypothetical protein
MFMHKQISLAGLS